MEQIHRSNERGSANLGWLKTYYSFSFADYYDPSRMGFRSLRVVNDDWIAPGNGFNTHPHANMEIITYVVDGELAHKDSMGHESIIRSNGWQKMSAGKGISHSEFNASSIRDLHLFQIWLLPRTKGAEPSYSEWQGDAASRGVERIAGPAGSDARLEIDQDANLSWIRLRPDQEVTLKTSKDRHQWMIMVSGAISLVTGKEQITNVLSKGDSISISNEAQIELKATEEASILYFDLA